MLTKTMHNRARTTIQVMTTAQRNLFAFSILFASSVHTADFQPHPEQKVEVSDSFFPHSGQIIMITSFLYFVGIPQYLCIKRGKGYRGSKIKLGYYIAVNIITHSFPHALFCKCRVFLTAKFESHILAIIPY